MDAETGTGQYNWPRVRSDDSTGPDYITSARHSPRRAGDVRSQAKGELVNNDVRRYVAQEPSAIARI